MAVLLPGGMVVLVSLVTYAMDGEPATNLDIIAGASS